MVKSRYSVRIGSDDFIIQPGTFQEGAIRRQPEVITLQDVDLKSRPDNREFWQTSWLGGAQWEKPVLSLQNLNTYYHGANIDLTATAGAVMPARYAHDESGLSWGTSGWSNAAHYVGGGVDGAVVLTYVTAAWAWYGWDGSTDSWNGLAVPSGMGASDVPYATTSFGDTVYVLTDQAEIISVQNTTGTTWVSSTDALPAVSGFNATPIAGAAIWADETYLWYYNGDMIARYDHATFASGELMVNDLLGPDVFQQESPTYPVIPLNSTPRAISTSEGVFYVKNVIVNGKVVAKIARIDRDASGAYIHTPIGTLPVGMVAATITHHLGSLIVATLPSFYRAMANEEHSQVTLYHVTGRSIGALGTMLGPESQDETPVNFLLSIGDMLYIGGARRMWQYDGRVGAIHPYYETDNFAIYGYGGGWFLAAPVLTTNGTATLLMHNGNNGSFRPYTAVLEDQTHGVASGQDSYLESNYFDFDLPMETKTVTELFYDLTDVRSTKTVTFKVKADDAASWTTVKMVTEGTDDLVGRVAITGVTGYKFQYRVEFGEDSASGAGPKLRSIGFSAVAGEMVKVMQFTINGWESVNVQNQVQDPKDVYDKLATLRDNADPVTVRHWYVSQSGADYAEDSYKVVSVMAQKDDPQEGLFDVTLMGAAAAGRVTGA